MRTVLTFSPVFNPEERTIDFTGMPAGYSQKKLYRITNITKHLIIYSLDSPRLMGTSVGNILTLNYDTRGQESTDDLQVVYEDTSLNDRNVPSTEVLILGNPSVNVSNTPNMYIANQPTVNLSSESKTGLTTTITGIPQVELTPASKTGLSVTLANTPEVTLAGTPGVAISNQPIVDLSPASKTGLSVSIANSPTVQIGGTPEVSLSEASKTGLSVAVSNQPTVNLSEASKSGLSTEIIGTPNVAIANQPTVDLSPGSKTGLSVSIANQPTVNVDNFPAIYPVTNGAGALTVDGNVGVNNFPAVYPVSLANTSSSDPNGRLRTSQITTLGDLKTLNQDSAILLENVGTGSGSFSQNSYSMSVTSGQYLIRRSRNYYPYFSGKSQIVECSLHSFNPQVNVTKRVGYFSSNAVAPYDSNKDGFWIEASGGSIKLVVSRNGVEKLNLDWSLWDNYNQISSYNWDNFTVVIFDYIWLGGAILRISLKTSTGFVVAHTFHYAGSSPETIMLSPNQNVRYEIRSSTGVGSMTYVCSQVGTEGSISESGKSQSINTGSSFISVGTVGTTYPLKAIRKNSTNRDTPARITGYQVLTNTSDTILITVQKNPIMSAGLTYTPIPNSGMEQANGNGTITVTTPGIILHSLYTVQNAIALSGTFDDDFLSWLGCSILNVSDQMVICGTPLSATVPTATVLNFKEY